MHHGINKYDRHLRYLHYHEQIIFSISYFLPDYIPPDILLLFYRSLTVRILKYKILGIFKITIVEILLQWLYFSDILSIFEI